MQRQKTSSAAIYDLEQHDDKSRFRPTE